LGLTTVPKINEESVPQDKEEIMVKEIVRRTAPMIAAAVLAATLGAVLAGCFLYGGTYGSNITAEQKAAIAKGKTTKVDLLKELGNPDQTVDLGGGKEQLSYIRETISGFGTSSQNTETWIVLNNGVVEDFGERPTTKNPSYLK
jgi:hypothetical protein